MPKALLSTILLFLVPAFVAPGPARTAPIAAPACQGESQMPVLLVPNDGTSRPPRLHVYQAQWGLEGLPRGEKPWTDEERFAKTAEAGWDGIDVVPSLNKADQARIAALAGKYNLRLGILCFLKRPQDIDAAIEAFVNMHADYLNSQVLLYPVKTEAGIEQLRAWIAKTRKLGIPFFTETHRGRITQDLFQTQEFAAALPELALCADLSHYIVAYELGFGLPKEYKPAFDTVFAHSCMIDGRVSNGEQVQIDVGPEGKNPHAERFAGYWKSIMTAWLQRAKPGDIFPFRTELGPPDYAVVDLDGREISDRFEQAKVLKRLAIRTWNDAVRETKIGEEHAP